MQLIKDKRDSQLYGDIRYSALSHRILSDGYPWLRWLRRVLKEPRLFCYQHRLSNNYILAMWTRPPSPGKMALFHEIEMLSGEPSEVWPFSVDRGVLLSITKPLEEHWKLQEKRLKEQQYSKSRLVSDALQERKEVCAFLRTQGMMEEATMIEEGRTSWEPSVTNPDEHAEFVRQLHGSVSYFYGS